MELKWDEMGDNQPILTFSIGEEEFVFSPLPFRRNDSGVEMLVLSRENSGAFGLVMSRENSGNFEAENLFPTLVREDSGKSLRLGLGFLLSPKSKDEDHVADNCALQTSNCSEDGAVSTVEIIPSCERTVAPAAAVVQLATQPFQAHQSPDDFPSCQPKRPPTKASSRRGLHVRGRLDMQQTARNGAVHWSQKVQEVRKTWQDRAAFSTAFRAEYGPQAEAASGRIKCKQECLLRFLHMAAADGLVDPHPFTPGRGFFGWTRFRVVPARADEFRRGIEGLFPEDFREDTLKETFRRSGLIPEKWQWDQGWRGLVSFDYRPKP